MRKNENVKRRMVVEYEIEYADKTLPEDRKSYLDAKCINALKGRGAMPEGVESVRIVDRA